MRLLLCDVCSRYKKPRLIPATFTLKPYRGVQSIDVCVKHKDFTQGKTREQIINWMFNNNYLK